MIAAIENAILARLKAAGDLGVLGYKFKSLETYPEEWDAYLKDKGAINAPAAWVTYAGWRAIDDENMGKARLRLLFGVVVMAENLRGETQTRHGGPGVLEPGSYRLIIDVARLLVGQHLDLPMGAIELGGMHHVRRLDAMKERKVSMLALEISTTVRIDQLQLVGGDLDDFHTFHANWDIEPFGNVDADPNQPGIQIPADDQADATDHVTLETNA